MPTDQSINPIAPMEKKSFFPPMSPFTYKTLNLSATALATCATVVTVETPVTRMVLNQLQKGTFLPRSTLAGRAGFFALMSNLYTGVGAQTAGSFARASYVTTAKQASLHPSTKPTEGLEIEASHESVQEETGLPKLFNRQSGLVASFALGDVIITHPFDTKRHLSVLQITDNQFNWKGAHNAFKLCTAHVGARYTSSLVNYGSLLLLSNQIATTMPIENNTLNHVVSGAISGAFAAAICFPLGYYRDYALSQASVVNGQLQTLKAPTIASYATDFVKNIGFRNALTQCYDKFKPQIIGRMSRSALIFACVEGISSLLGQEPLKEVIPESGKTALNGFSLFSRKPEQNSNVTITEINEGPAAKM